MNLDVVIPGRAEGAGPESIITDRGYGFRARRFAVPRNDRKLKLNARRLLELGAGFPEIEERALREAERSGE
jgi:hypothetical protein